MLKIGEKCYQISVIPNKNLPQALFGELEKNILVVKCCSSSVLSENVTFSEIQVMYLCLPTLCLPKTGKEPLFANFFLKKKFSGKKRLFANFFSWGNEKLFWTWNSTLSTFSRQILFRTSFQSNFIFLFLCLNWI